MLRSNSEGSIVIEKVSRIEVVEVRNTPFALYMADDRSLVSKDILTLKESCFVFNKRKKKMK